jgi:hypothetical protein
LADAVPDQTLFKTSLGGKKPSDEGAEKALFARN